ncbi:hypothetical protein [Parabacteroides sp. FAFU027]|uniref:hypothetical protein n=1 Tax=Parabacteroides sp. FAFU027 TaxID=2922715 RepID=UPI001FAEB64F|nr:hypothetical protein [Parabacteroides sp. FAFU027]
MNTKISILLLAILFVSCNKTSNKKTEKIKSVYYDEIQYEEMDIDFSHHLNPARFEKEFHCMHSIKDCFVSIQAALKNNRDEKLIKDQLRNILSIVGNDNMIKKRIQFFLDEDLSSFDNNTLDILMLELHSKVLNELSNSSSKESFLINSLTPVIVPESKVVRAGGLYNAKIFLAVNDSLCQIKAFHEKNEIPIVKNKAILKIKAEKKGTHNTTVKIQIQNDRNGNCYGFIHDISFEVK